ncbi:MAG: TolC family protein [Gemmatimonadota bacterium]|nr:TolC family protein [Gemmatimonadota bacterium]
MNISVQPRVGPCPWYTRVARRPLRRALLAAGLAFVPYTLSFAQVTMPPAAPRGPDSVSAGTTPVTLAQAIGMAQRNAPAAIAARGSVTSSKAELRSAYGAFLPSITANFGAGRQFTGSGSLTRVNSAGETVTINGNKWNYSNSLGFSAQLFNAANIPNVRAARADIAAANQSVTNQQFQVALSVEQQFYASLSALESEDAARAQLAQAQQQLDFSRRRVVAGAATASDSLTAVVLVANAQLALRSAQNARRDANATLTRVAGSPVPLSAALNDAEVMARDTIRVDSASVVARAEASPNVAQATAQLAAADARRQSARASYLPTLNASYSRGGSGTGAYGFGADPFVYTGQLNLGLSIPIFNGFVREQQVANATVNQANAAASLHDAKLAAKQLSVLYIDALRLGQEQIAVQTASIAAATENLRVVQQRYNLGLSTIVDLLTAQTTLNQARANLIAARNNARLATAQIEALIGQPLVTVTTGQNGVTR